MDPAGTLDGTWNRWHHWSSWCLCVLRDVSSVELLMKYHQGIKAEVDARGKNFTDCIELGKKLLQRKHQDSPEVRESRIGGDGGDAVCATP